MCVQCGEMPARNERIYKHACKHCVASIDIDEHYEIVREESNRYLETTSTQQQWTGVEPALQMLLLPAKPSTPLPRYAATPEHLSPEHCRLCFQAVQAAELPAHLQDAHGISEQEYRRNVLCQTLTEWPQPISPQILRTRLAAFKAELCDDNFRCVPCASCCLLYTSPSPRDGLLSRMPSSA